ncbi:MAG: ABC-F family ATP-binding cassette domain-containing protein [Clostridiales bacterium]|nr:ABC-F family ATP-binding cassette domain-containing protein [Clostridiales bacterium]
MLVISGKNINKTYGTDIILDDVSFNVNKGDRAGIVGPNGAGKTTLLKIISGEIEQSSGNIYIKSGLTVGYLKQNNNFDLGGTVETEAQKTFDNLYKMEEDIRSLSVKISDHTSPSFDKDLEEYTALMDEFEKEGGYTYKSELRSVLENMGFGEDDLGKRTDKLSGGERTRLALSCILLQQPDIMILDEPTNHLDLKMLAWLENFLKSYKGTIIVVSHDRYFLDRIVTSIYDMNAGILEEYSGNYSDFVIRKAERLEAMHKEYEKQQKETARQEEMIRRFKQHGTEHLAKRAKSREKKLSHVNLLPKPITKQEKMKLSFDIDYKSGTEVVIADNMVKSFGERTLFRNVSCNIRKGERVCIIGDNGIGKTTLLKVITGKEKLDNGYLKIGYNVNFGYYDQGQRLLDDKETVLGEMKNAYHLYTDTEMRSLLGRFLFKGDDVFKLVGSLSGGEKAKLSLLKLMLSGSNTLVLDEPTNHLDIPSKEIVEEALLEFNGTLIIVSHDRYLLTKIPDRILELTEEGLVEYKGDFDYYLDKSKLEEERKDSVSSSENIGAGLSKTIEMVRSSEEEREVKKKLEAELRRKRRRSEDIESSIHELEGVIADIESSMCEIENLHRYEWLQEQADLMADYEEKVGRLYDEWMELQN